MPLREVKPLSNKQWEYVMKVIYSKDPDFVKMRKKMQKTVKEALKRTRELKHDS